MHEQQNEIPAVDTEWVEQQKKITEKTEAIVAILDGETYWSALNILAISKHVLTSKSIVKS